MSEKIRVSDYIVRFLEEKGVDTVFLLSGGGMMHLLDAVGRSQKIKTVSQHHEQCSGFAADGYARLKNNIGCAFATSGPGALNLVTAICSSYQDSTPVLYFTGQAKLVHTIQHTKVDGLRQMGTFEADIVSVTKSITKNSTMLTNANDIRYELEKSYWLATSGRPGPCLIDIPVDLQGALISPESLRSFVPTKEEKNPSSTQFSTLSEKIKNAKRPLIVAGHGVRVSNTVESLHSFSQKTNVPIVTTGMAADIVEFDNESLIGHLGVKGDRAGNIAVQNSDLLIFVGTSLPAMVTGYEIPLFAPNAFKVLVDPDPATHKKQEVKIDLNLEINLKDFFAHFLKSIENQSFQKKSDWLSLCHSAKNDLRVDQEPHNTSGDKLNYYEIIEQLNKASKPYDVFVTDAGLPFYLMGQAYRPKAGQRMIVSGALGQMGYALPATTGACFADPKKNIICITGDGSVQTNLHELSVIQYHNLNAKILIVNNNGYVSIRNTQNNYFGGLLVGTDPEHGVPLPNLEIFCKSIGMKYIRFENRAQFEQGFTQKYEEKGPYVIEILARENQEVIPSVSSYKTSEGKMISKPIDDMFPFMDKDKLKKYLISTNS